MFRRHKHQRKSSSMYQHELTVILVRTEEELSRTGHLDHLHSFPLMRKKVPAATPRRPKVRPSPQKTAGPTPGCFTSTTANMQTCEHHLPARPPACNNDRTVITIVLTPYPGVWVGHVQVLDTAAVNVSLLRDKGESGDLCEGFLFVGVGNAGAGSFGHFLSIPGPGDVYGSRIKTSHKTDQSVLLHQLDFFSGIDPWTGGRN